MSVKPVRIQRSRAKGSKLVSPNGLPVVYVGRPSKWGNPYALYRTPYGGWCVGEYRDNRIWCIEAKWWRTKHEAILDALAYYRESLNDVLRRDTIRGELRGKNLACWCELGTPCHADVLLEVANS